MKEIQVCENARHSAAVLQRAYRASFNRMPLQTNILMLCQAKLLLYFHQISLIRSKHVDVTACCRFLEIQLCKT